jgi:hypothetical protein
VQVFCLELREYLAEGSSHVYGCVCVSTVGVCVVYVSVDVKCRCMVLYATVYVSVGV